MKAADVQTLGDLQAMIEAWRGRWDAAIVHVYPPRAGSKPEWEVSCEQCQGYGLDLHAALVSLESQLIARYGE